MSELDTKRIFRNPRLNLMIGVSAFALTAYIASSAEAEETTRPTVWIELGSQFEEFTGKNELFAPPFDSQFGELGFPSVTAIENVLGKSYGGEGSLTFHPAGSDWVFTAAVRYGRTRSSRLVHQQKVVYATPIGPTPGGGPKKDVVGNILRSVPFTSAYVDQNVKNSEDHTILDFQVGKDVGLGLFGHGTDSVISFGARYVRLKTTSAMDTHMWPDLVDTVVPNNVPLHKYIVYNGHHNSASAMQHDGDFRALGPSLSLNNTTRLMGGPADGELAIDWGVNAALLFGRQGVHVHHQSTPEFHYGNNHVNIESGANTRTGSRHITVPDLGGFAAISYRFANAKLTAGYRADFFFGAMDTGLDTRNMETVGFHGPFASFSIGLGG